MKPAPTLVRLGTLIFILTATACSSVPRQYEGESPPLAQYESRRDKLAGLDGWSMQGRLAVSDGKDGGNGTLSWRQSAGENRLDFHGALGRGAWTIESGVAGARLQMADGRSYMHHSLKELVENHLGWHVPVDDLSWWVRGLSAPGGAEQQSLGEEGELTVLKQSGWDIEFTRYREQGGVLLPGKLVARKNGKSVKLAVRKWTLEPKTAGN